MSPITSPILCYVTDRRGLATTAAQAGDEDEFRLPALAAAIERATTAGVDWIQIREKDLPASWLVELARAAVAAAGSRSRILVNDRLDVARAAGTGGVHLGETSLPVAKVVRWLRGERETGRVRADFLAGFSCHSLASARAAERDGADYLFFGPVFDTPSKAAFGPPQGLARLREVCSAVRIPVLAIGGVGPENAAECLQAGAAGLAAIRMFQESGQWEGLLRLLSGKE